MSETEAQDTGSASAEAVESSGAVATESTESQTPAQATETSAEPTQTQFKPAGYAPIDPATATPEQTKERLDYLYGQIKPTQRENKEMKRILADQSRVIEELSKGQQLVVDHLTQKSFTESKEQLQRTMQEAWKKGDERSYIEAQNKLMELNVEERVAAKQKPQQQPQQSNGHIPNNAVEMANGALQSGGINDTEYRATESWQNETDESGNILRPWAYADSPYYKSALRETAAVFDNPRLQNLSYEQKLAEVDKRMGLTKRSPSQAVMGGNLTRPTKKATIELSPKQREIALKSKYAGKGKSDDEHLNAYRKQLEKFQQTRRAK